VLDAAPVELVRLVGYLEAVTDKLLIDLVTVSAFEVNGSRILVPQRVEPERWPPEAPRATGAPRETGYGVPGADDFLAVIAHAPQEQQVFLRRLTEWAIGLGQRGLVPEDVPLAVGFGWGLHDGSYGQAVTARSSGPGSSAVACWSAAASWGSSW